MYYSDFRLFENHFGVEDRGVFHQWCWGVKYVPKIIDLVMLIFVPVIIFLATSISILLSRLIVKK